jgi:hypothetical protein
LPVAAADGEPAPATHEGLAGLRALIVDDSAPIAASPSTMPPRRWPQGAADGMEALIALRQVARQDRSTMSRSPTHMPK